MLLEKLFIHFNYICRKKCEGIGIFQTSERVKFYYKKTETLFTDGEIIKNNKSNGEIILSYPSYCIAANNTESEQMSFEVYLADSKEETVEKASKEIKRILNQRNSIITEYFKDSRGN